MCKSIHLLFFVLLFNFSFSQNSQESIIEDSIEKALKKAKKENKQVFVNYLSSECELSANMEKQMKNEAFKSVFNSNYVVVNIEVSKEETSNYVNCSNPVKKFSGNNCTQIKFPFWYVLDNNGEFTGTSFKDDSSNIGYPSTKEDMNLFMEVIRNTSKFTEANINMIENSFKIASN